MKYLAHITDDKKHEQTIKEHLEGTAQLAYDFSESFGYGEWGYCCGMLHDIGKYSEAFQARICGEDMKMVDHSTAGAQLCGSLSGFYPMLSYCIAGHHSGLPDTGDRQCDSHSKTMMGRMQKKVEDYSAYKNEVEIPELIKEPFRAKERNRVTFTYSMFIRMLYSCLVDADYLDTEYFMNQGNVERFTGENMMKLLKKLENYVGEWFQNTDLTTVNGHRTEILKRCHEMGKGERGLYRLTVPTGGGKTIASLAFALQQAVTNEMDRVIYVIPYTSIIEQNAQIFREILGTENVLENHSNVEYEDSEELLEMQLASENWDKPVVVTTNVQFFESFFSNKSSKCRKLHNVANSVIIFDEAQMLPNDYLIPCIAVIEELVKNYRCSVVLCTATQPALQKFFSKECEIKELCPDVEEQFKFFKRTRIEKIGKVTIEEFVGKVKNEQQALCILNTKNKVRKIYREIVDEGVYHLSTYMYPLHRKRVLKEIKERLENDEKCIVIATSLVEAGVDLDFKTVYRELAGIDSVIQAAGRCNRNGKNRAEESNVYVFELDGFRKNTNQRQQIDSAKYIIEEEEDITSQEAIRKYFEMLYHYRGETLDKKGILEQFDKMNFPFDTVAKQFKLIEDDTKTIFIAKEKEAEELLEEIRSKGINRHRLRKAGKYSISVRKKEFEEMVDLGMLMPIVGEMKEDFFTLRDKEVYTWETGIEMESTIIM